LNAAKEKLEIVSGAAPPPFRIFAGGLFRKNAFGLIQEYCTNLYMYLEIIEKVQNRVIQLLPIDKQEYPGILLKDTCSEVVRLVASWIKLLDKSVILYVIKGNNVCNTKKSHNILIIKDLNGLIYVVNPTVWQFFPKLKSILIFSANDINIALDRVKEIYEGKWSISEEFIGMTEVEEKKYLNIISQNINENLDSI